MEIKPLFGKISERTDRHFCFVLMPFSKKFCELFEDSIKKIAKKNRLECKKADDIYSVNPIMQDIWESINKSEIIIADLTTRNPNVFYETGIAHTLGKKVILLTQKINDVPFDLKPLRIIPYEFTPRGVRKLERDLDKSIKSILTKKQIRLRIKKKTIQKSVKITKTTPMVLWNERMKKNAGEEFLVYEIPARKNTILTGKVSSKDPCRFYLVDKNNLQQFKKQNLYSSRLNSVQFLTYNFHFPLENDENLYLMIGTEVDKSSTLDISLNLESNTNPKNEIIWDEIGFADENSDRPYYYPVSAEVGDIIDAKISTIPNCNVVLLDSANFVLYRQQSEFKKVKYASNVSSKSIKFKSNKTDVWVFVVEKKPDEKMEVKTFITKLKRSS